MTRSSMRALRAAAAMVALPVATLAAQEHRHAEGAHGASPAGAHAHHAPTPPPTSRAPSLVAGLGTWHLAVTTRVPMAQRFFDQGLRLAYAFNHDESVRSFAEAARLDATCAMCWWGLAYALGPNINAPVSPEAEARALDAVGRARGAAARATPRERALVEALATRFGPPAGASPSARAARDSAYAGAMREVARRFPDDADVQVLFADAMMNLRPWKQWKPDGTPQPGTLEVVATLERAMAQAPEHAGACHFYVHAVEASPDPDRALPCAERLGRLMPGAGHIVHMPAHVYLRTGRYADAARANIAAVAADSQYIGRHTVQGDVYPMVYTPHNSHFLWMAYVLSGQKARAAEAAGTLQRIVAVDHARAIPSLQAFLSVQVLTHARFGDWDAVLAEPAPAAGLDYVRGLWHHARGLARTARGDVARARTELDALRAIAAATPEDVIIIQNPARTVLTLAGDVLEARIALREGNGDRAVALLRGAVGVEDALTYDEPPAWYHSTRHLLGTTLLALGRAAEAEAAFTEDLRVFRENGWSLAGLERALRVQGRSAEADAIASRLAAAWKDADAPALAIR